MSQIGLHTVSKDCFFRDYEGGKGSVQGFHDDFLVAQAPPPSEELPEPEPEASANEEEEMLSARLQVSQK
jgi:hypothetical protein